MEGLKLEDSSGIILTDREILILISSVSLRAWPLLDYIRFPEIVRQNRF